MEKKKEWGDERIESGIVKCRKRCREKTSRKIGQRKMKWSKKNLFLSQYFKKKEFVVWYYLDWLDIFKLSYVALDQVHLFDEFFRSIISLWYVRTYVPKNVFHDFSNIRGRNSLSQPAALHHWCWHSPNLLISFQSEVKFNKVSKMYGGGSVCREREW